MKLGNNDISNLRTHKPTRFQASEVRDLYNRYNNKIWRLENLEIWKCENGKILKYEKAQVQKSENMKV